MTKQTVIKKNIKVQNKEVVISENDPVYRYPGNPILTAEDVNKVWKSPHLKVVTVHNSGITKYNNEILMMFRSHLRSGISVLGIARSRNGLDKWKIDPQPALLPATNVDEFDDLDQKKAIIENEAGGLEDPRITNIGDNYFITYSAYHGHKKNHVRIHLAVTQDFKEYMRYGAVSELDMRNVVIFPEKIKGNYFGLFRPNGKEKEDIGGMFTQIKIGHLEHWQTNKWNLNSEPIMRTGGGPSAIQDKIGPGAPPIKTGDGRWLSIFHGVRNTMSGNPYVLSVALHDSIILEQVKVSDIPIMFPTANDCKVRSDCYEHVPQVVFSCGALKADDGTICIYYGGNDTVMNVAFTHEDVLISLCENYGRDPLTGERLYKL